MKRNKIVNIILCLLATLVSGNAYGYRRTVTPNTVDSLRQALSRTDNAKDSIDIMFNIYDALMLSPDQGDGTVREGIDVLDQLYDISLRDGDTIRAYDALRYLSTVSRYDVPMVDKQLNRLARMPRTADMLGTRTYLKMQRYVWALRDTTLTEDERRDNFYKMRRDLDLGDKPEKSIYDRLDQQFAMVLYGSNLVKPDEMNKYLKDLGMLVDMAHDRRSQIRLYFYRIAALIYDENAQGDDAVRMDRESLKILDKLDIENEKNGRIYKNYDDVRFTIYRRMLGNYPSLSKDSVRLVHNELEKILDRLPKSRLSDIERLSVPAMWNMFNQNYGLALSQLRTLMTSKRFLNKPNYVRAYMYAAAAMGGFEDLDNGLNLYTDLIVGRAKDAADVEYSRLRVEYEVDTLKANSIYAARKAAEAEKNASDLTNRYIKYAMYGLGFLLFAILIIQIVSNIKTRRIAKRLKDSNQRLAEERNSLNKTKIELEDANAKAKMALRQRTEFIHNVSHEVSEPVKVITGYSQLVVDSVPEERRKYLSTFIDIIDHNSTILQRIVGDIIDTVELDEMVANVMVTRFQPEEVCQLAADSFKSQTKPGQSIIIEPIQIVGKVDVGDKGIDSDAVRLEQILVNLLSNAVKFSDRGEIKISPVLDYNSKELRIAVSDHGPGIPKGKEEQIFERFERLGHYTSGLGLGLYVARELTKLLSGTLVVDTEYTEGARFILTIPMSIRSFQKRMDPL